jgi:plastocyanin
MRHALIAALLGATVLAGCGSDSTSAPSSATPASDAAATTSIAIKQFKYSPTPATVKAGRRISVSNGDSAPHTLTDRATGRAFDSGTVNGGETGSVTFSKPGTYAYFCEFHPYMKGSVTVTG